MLTNCPIMLCSNTVNHFNHNYNIIFKGKTGVLDSKQPLSMLSFRGVITLKQLQYIKQNKALLSNFLVA